jgi:hypothetical protein
MYWTGLLRIIAYFFLSCCCVHHKLVRVGLGVIVIDTPIHPVVPPFPVVELHLHPPPNQRSTRIRAQQALVVIAMAGPLLESKQRWQLV